MTTGMDEAEGILTVLKLRHHPTCREVDKVTGNAIDSVSFVALVGGGAGSSNRAIDAIKERPPRGLSMQASQFQHCKRVDYG